MSDSQVKAAAAKRLLDDPLLTEVLDQIEAAAFNAWRTTKMDDAASREIAYHALKASERVRNALKGIVDNGLIEANRIVRSR